jgi:uncharacterized protein
MRPGWIKKVEAEVKNLLSEESTGHDWHHIRQVKDMALRIARIEGGDENLIELAALVHDVGDRKLHASEKEGEEVTLKLLKSCGVPAETIDKVMDIVRSVSFKGAHVADTTSTLESKIVQDADRLYALGSIGIARTFAYGGAKGRLLHDPDRQPTPHNTEGAYYGSKSPTIHHFYEKLLLLKDRMHTPTARTIAESRHEFMEEFLRRFYLEWDVKD